MAPVLVRPAVVAGAFYPADPAALAAHVDALLAAAGRATPAGRLRGLIVPHAGTVYSGPVAASAYAWLRSAPAAVRPASVLLLGPAHRVPLRGVATTAADELDTPLGRLPVDVAARDRLLGAGLVTVDDDAHAPEHSLEVQLPFLLRTLGPVPALPLLVGAGPSAEAAAAVEAAWGPDTLLVCSTDLSHYEDLESARRHDARTAARIVACDPEAIGPSDACGARPLAAVLTTAARRGYRVRLLDLRTSGDTAGPRDRVVGYGAFAITEPDA
jgi:AmmeMemoRadiSam system protein B